MEVEFKESYTKLSDMKPGDCAVSKDRKKFFVCGFNWDEVSQQKYVVILEMGNLEDYNIADRDEDQPVTFLKPGDRFECKR